MPKFRFSVYSEQTFTVEAESDSHAMEVVGMMIDDGVFDSDKVYPGVEWESSEVMEVQEAP